VVISFDQMGPVSLKPTQGAGWARRGRPERHRATYNRRAGVRYVMGAYDVHGDHLRTRMRPRRTGAENLAFMRQLRLCYRRRRRIFWIQDNLSANWTPDIRDFAAESNIELVPLPTYASYLNRIECHFGPIQEFVFNNADYLDWAAARHALADYTRYRNGPYRDPRIAGLERKLTVAA
jgi:hypothetical protein